MYLKCGYEYQLFSHLNFPSAAILNFYDAIWLQLFLAIVKNQRSFVFNGGANILCHKKSKWGSAGNFKEKIRHFF